MGSASVTSQYSDGYSSFTAYATITWDSTPTVTVSNVYGDNSAFYWRIVLRGDSSTRFTSELSASVTSASFSGSFGTSYVFQTCGSNGTWNNTGDSVFTVTDDSSSGGGDGTYVNKYITIIQGDNTELTVTRTKSENSALYTGVLSNGDEVWHGDKLDISRSALPGYELDLYQDAWTGLMLDVYLRNIMYSDSVTESPFNVYAYPLASPAYPEVRTSATLKQYMLSVSQGEHSSISITRISSNKSDASIGVELADGDTIYHFDELQVNFEVDAGYNCSVSTASGQVLSDGDVIQVSDDVSIVSDTTVKQYTLTLEPDIGSTIIVRRTSSPLQNATIGVVNNNETIYHSDVLEITLSSSPEYKIVNQYVNQEAFASGDTFEVTEDITVKTVTELHGIAYIYDGASFGQYLIHIFHNGEWAQYIPYVYKDSTWNICS